MQTARAVARFNTNGHQCTGTLINNEANNGRAFFLTAFHCIDVGGGLFGGSNGVIDPDEEAALADATFQFQFWRTQCNGTVNNPFIEFSGAVLREAWRNTDVVLLELIRPPGIGDAVNYAGYSRQTDPPSKTQSFILHHPDGAVMRVTSTRNVKDFFWDNMFWTAHYSSGTVTGGSSGAALFNEFGQVVGQLRGGWSSCNFTDFGDRYGKFNHSWNGAGLQQWLSPNQGFQATGTLDLTNIPINGPDMLPCTTTPGTYTTLPGLLDVTYEWVVSSNMQIVSGQFTHSGSIRFINTSAGAGTITLILRSPTKGWNRTYTVSKTVNGSVPDINNFNFLASNPSCISYNNQTFSFGVGFNGYDGCQIKDQAGITDVEWQVFSPQPYQVNNNDGIYSCNPSSYLNNAGISVSLSYPSQPYVVSFIFRVKNVCGWSEWSPGYYYFAQACGGGWRFVTSPNPTSGIMNVALDEETLKTDKVSEIREIQVMDKFGKIVKQFKFSSGNKKANINISELRADVYFIKIFNGKEWKGKSVIKQ